MTASSYNAERLQRFASADKALHMTDIFSPVSPSITDNVDKVEEYVKVEWIDAYANAHRIAQENREHMRRWLNKIPLQILLKQIKNDYIDKMDVLVQEKITDMIDQAIDDNDPRFLVYIYTAATPFFGQLNKDLAAQGRKTLTNFVLSIKIRLIMMFILCL
jgi:hypothetical protein